ncbi:MAG: M15 family metallopeptidase [Candidatus Promineifilaceae bacterium]|nr:M15 family metallopeptidase [Candidatus Promineifilaceae bacterium]
MPDDGLLTLVTQEYAVSRHYTPSDLVPLEEYIPADILLGYPIELRRVAAEPLRELINAMHAAELSPTVISGYRSYAAQAIAWKKWVGLEPERVAIISAQPGHSEHQLGTTVDFGSPELEEIVGQPDIEFHTYFYKTGEGVWLAEHAHEFGFVQSYPREALELTGFYYEPWHYRYVGVDLAAELHEAGITLTELLLERHGAPCIP